MSTTRTTLFLFAAGAAALVGCGLSSPTKEAAKPERSEDAFIVGVRRAVPVAHLDGISDRKLIIYGDAACVRVANGETPAHVFDSMYAGAETEGEMKGADALVETARAALETLCPDAS